MQPIKSTFLAVALMAGLAQAGWCQRVAPENDRTPTPVLTVSAEGEVMAAPDRATVRLGAEAQEADAAAAQSRVNAIVQKTIEQIQALGIEAKKIQTTGLSLQPIYEQRRPPQPREGEEYVEPRTPRIVAYRASNVVQVTVDNLALVGKVIDAGVGTGANRLEGVTFDLQNELPSRMQALQQAVAKARAKAQALAQATEVRLVEIIDVQEGGGYVQPLARGMELMNADFASTPVQPGQLTVQANVTLRYRIAPAAVRP